MSREWKYTINGKYLRELISNGDGLQILKGLNYEITYFLKRKLNLDSDLQYEFEDLKNLIEDECLMDKKDLLDWINKDSLFSNLEELVDDRLEQFYDLCDRWDIFITLD